MMNVLKQQGFVVALIMLLLQATYAYISVLCRGPRSREFLPIYSRLSNPISGEYDFEKWSRAFTSQLNEFDYEITNIEGIIPVGLEGELFRSMPARFERGGRSYGHYLDGDGYVAKISIEQGRTFFKSKFVRTKEFVDEEEAGEIMYRSSFRTQREDKSWVLGSVICPNNAFDLRLKNGANTNSMYWANRLMIFFEAGVPHLVCPKTLDTIGPYDMGVGLKSGMAVKIPSLYEFNRDFHDHMFGAAMTAHPKIDRFRNTFIGWTWRAEVDLKRGPLATNPTIDIYEWDSAMKSAPPTMHKFSFTSVAPHDFSITENYYVFVENRIGGDTLPYILGTKCPAECVDIEPLSPMVLNAIKRPSSKDSIQDKNIVDTDTIRLNLRPGFSIHSVCSFEKSKFVNGKVVNTLELYTSAWKCETIESGKVKGGLLGSWEGAAPKFDEIPETLLYKTEVDLDSKVILSHAPVTGMENVIVEHPHINPKFEGRPVRYLYMSIGSLKGISSPPLGYLRLDLTTGEKHMWFAPQHTYCEELVVVPKNQNLDLVDEEDVWLLGTMFDAEEGKSCLAVFEGNQIENGPICRMWLTHGLPHSLHGCFVSSS